MKITRALARPVILKCSLAMKGVFRDKLHRYYSKLLRQIMKQLNYDTIYCKSINCSHPAGFVEIPNQLFRGRLLLHERKQIAGILFWDSQHRQILVR